MNQELHEAWNYIMLFKGQEYVCQCVILHMLVEGENITHTP